jgi:hypothetical protein
LAIQKCFAQAKTLTNNWYDTILILQISSCAECQWL